MKIFQTVTELWGEQEIFGKKNQKGKTLKLKKEGKSFLHVTHRLYLIHIPIKLHEDIMKVSQLWSVQ